ncbi:MAG TPA: 3-phenylpropionate/cinnamic acid dioxygenase subunit beta [Acidimicrobiia bacterium]|nr:3-phenylpropionate/cinnamic acid dioxygenase subunit beta [Acidimicrobiia bacterium]
MTLEMTPAVTEAGPALQYEVEQFLYLEARLLDRRRFRDWYALLADDLEYRVPLRTNRSRRDMAMEESGVDELALFDDNKFTIGQRITRIETGAAWAEDPPSRTRHMVGNVTVSPGAAAGEYQVECAYLLYRSRLEREIDIFVGERVDVLRRTDTGPGFEIARRKVLIDQATLDAKNLSIFF